MTKFIIYYLNFIFFLILNVDAFGAQLQNNNNQILSSIYAEYNNDYLTWKTLPRYTDNFENNNSILNKIITDNQEHIDKLESNNNFTLDEDKLKNVDHDETKPHNMITDSKRKKLMSVLNDLVELKKKLNQGD